MALSKVNPNFVNVSQVGGRRNLIINGAMQVAQRGTSSTGTAGYQTVDRFTFSNSNTNTTITQSQQQDGPNGFQYCVEFKNTTAGTPASNAYLEPQTRLEGNDARILNQSDAFTLSFYYKSNITATLPVQIYHRTDANSNWTMWKGVSVIGDGEWHRAELTFTKNTAVAADPKTGTDWGFIVGMNFELGTDYVNTSNENVWENNGSVKGPNFGLCGSLNNYIRITGMQVEIGDTATPFEHRSYGEELALCQRYYEKGNVYFLCNVNGSQWVHSYKFHVEKRTTPALTKSISSDGGGDYISANGVESFKAGKDGGSVGRTYSGTWTADAEL